MPWTHSRAKDMTSLVLRSGRLPVSMDTEEPSSDLGDELNDDTS